MRERVTLLFVRDDEVLLLYRCRNGEVYYVTPGGGVEPGETIVQAALREGQEETGLDFELGPLLWQRPFPLGYEYAFLVTQFSGTLRLGGPEKAANGPDNVYRLTWHPLTGVNRLVRYPGPIDLKAVRRGMHP